MGPVECDIKDNVCRTISAAFEKEQEGGKENDGVARSREQRSISTRKVERVDFRGMRGSRSTGEAVAW